MAKKGVVFFHYMTDVCGKATILLGVLPIILPIKRRFTYEKAFTVSVIS
ncbi:hypothetical protein KS731_002613 [Salmonella enterica]|nr:hypothetical protein [Salmonella enterica]EJV6085064.1 hypothetical protein [Salmonella enterica]